MSVLVTQTQSEWKRLEEETTPTTTLSPPEETTVTLEAEDWYSYDDVRVRAAFFLVDGVWVEKEGQTNGKWNQELGLRQTLRVTVTSCVEQYDPKEAEEVTTRVVLVALPQFDYDSLNRIIRKDTDDLSLGVFQRIELEDAASFFGQLVRNMKTLPKYQLLSQGAIVSCETADVTVDSWTVAWKPTNGDLEKKSGISSPLLCAIAVLGQAPRRVVLTLAVQHRAK